LAVRAPLGDERPTPPEPEVEERRWSTENADLWRLGRLGGGTPRAQERCIQKPRSRAPLAQRNAGPRPHGEHARPEYASVFLSFRYAPHRLLCDYVPPAARVLDVGSGAGALAEELRRRGATVVCLERDAFLAAQAQQRGLEVYKLDVAVDPMEALGLFDVAICADVLEHLRDPGAVLRRIEGRLRPGGLLLVSIPNVAFVSVRFGLLMGRFNYQSEGLLDATHLRFFTHRTSRKLLEDAGFRIDAESITIPIPAGAAPSLAPRVQRLMERPRLGAALYRAMSLLPGLFGYQFIYAARKRDATA